MDHQRELPKIKVPPDVAAAFRAISAETGASQAWLRRQAYVEYLARRAAPLPPDQEAP